MFTVLMMVVYVAPNLDPLATARDAFSLDWIRWKTVFPFSATVQDFEGLNRLEDFQGTAYLVAPRWPARIWFPLLEVKSMSSFPLDASLSQRVGEEIVFDSYSLHKSLHV